MKIELKTKFWNNNPQQMHEKTLKLSQGYTFLALISGTGLVFNSTITIWIITILQIIIGLIIYRSYIKKQEEKNVI